MELVSAIAWENYRARYDHALGIEAHKHHHVAEGVDKAAIKVQIRALKKKRDTLKETHASKEYRAVLREIHHLKNRLRAAIK